MTGKVKVWFIDRGYGFVAPDDGSDSVFLHVTKVALADQEFLVPGIAIEFTAQETAKGRAAVDARIIRDAKDQKMETENSTPSEGV